jgi:Carboxypeptidase regulatory-like domain
MIPRFNGTNNMLHLPHAARWVLLLSISVAAFSNSASSFAQSQQPIVAGVQEMPTVSQQSASEKPQSGSISGTVVDQDGALIADVKIILAQPGATSSVGTSTRETHSDGDGHFAFPNVAPGPFQLSLTASGFAPLGLSGTLHANEDDVLAQVVLAVATNTVDVEVTLPLAQIAEDQVKVEEKQRLLGVFPNFYVTYDPKAVPLTTKLKFQLAWKTTVDPVSFAIIGGIAGIEQANNAFSGYGQGMQGYAKRYGAAYADFVSGTFIGSAILPSLLKQDPRYFVKGTGTTRARLLYAIANSVVCKGDNRRWQPNYSFIIGDLAAGGISNLYYPAQNRNGLSLTFENALIAIGGGAVGNVIQEFFLRKLTPHAQDQNVPAQGQTKP